MRLMLRLRCRLCQSEGRPFCKRGVRYKRGVRSEFRLGLDYRKYLQVRISSSCIRAIWFAGNTNVFGAFAMEQIYATMDMIKASMKSC